MKWILLSCGLFVSLLAASFLWKPPIELDRVGALSLKQTVNAQSDPIYFTWDIPAEEARKALKSLAPCTRNYRRAMFSGSHEGTLQFDGREHEVRFLRVKQASTAVVVVFQGHWYVLLEPDSDAFYELLGRYERQQKS